MEKQATLFAAFLVFSSVCFAAAPVLEVSPEDLEFTASLGGTNPENQVLSIWRGGGNGPLNWEVAEDCNWLVVEPNSGTSMGEVDDVNVIVDISELAEGLYNCELTVSAGTAVNSPQLIPVELSIIIAGDLDGDFDVDLYDYGVLAGAWMAGPLDSHWNSACDISEPNDNIIDGFDLMVLAYNWLAGLEAEQALIAEEVETDATSTVVISLVDEGNWWVAVSYDASAEPNFVRAFALDITASAVNIVEIDSLSTDYWVYPGSIYIDTNGEVNDLGSPIADSTYPGTLGGLDTNGITIEMCALFDPLTESPPPSSGTLLRLRLQPDRNTSVYVRPNSIRGGVVMNDPNSTPTVIGDREIVCGDCPWDVDGNGFVNKTDRALITTYLNVNASPPFWSVPTLPGDEMFDVDCNGWVNKTDRAEITNALNQAGPFGDICGNWW